MNDDIHEGLFDYAVISVSFLYLILSQRYPREFQQFQRWNVWPNRDGGNRNFGQRNGRGKSMDNYITKNNTD